MNSNTPWKSPILLCCFAAVTAFGLGWFAHDLLSPAAEKLSSAAVRENHANSADADLTAAATPPIGGTESSATLGALPLKKIRAQVFQALSEPDQVIRLREICRLLEGMTKENWQEMKEAFVRQTIHTGRTHDMEWALLLHRAGQVGGAEAMTWEETAKARPAAEGFGSANPAAALEWVKKDPKDKRAGYILEGVALSDPKAALAAVALLPEEARKKAGRSVMAAAIGKNGLVEAEKLYAEIALSDASNSTRSGMFSTIVESKIKVSDLKEDPAELLEWTSGYLTSNTPIQEDMMFRIVGSAASQNPTEALQWVNQNIERIPPGDVVYSYNAIARVAPEQMVEWRETNPKHPWMGTIAECAADGLFQRGKAEEAAAWIDLIPDPKRKERYVTELSRQRARQKPAL